jgi:signal transduction histidine kinase
VSARPHDQSVEIAVEDNGPGVAADVRNKLFEPFVTTKEVGKGATSTPASTCQAPCGWSRISRRFT